MRSYEYECLDCHTHIYTPAINLKKCTRCGSSHIKQEEYEHKCDNCNLKVRSLDPTPPYRCPRCQDANISWISSVVVNQAQQQQQAPQQPLHGVPTCKVCFNTFGQNVLMQQQHGRTFNYFLCIQCGHKEFIRQTNQPHPFMGGQPPTGGQQSQPMSPNTSHGVTKCRIWWDKDLEMYQISTPYNREFTSVLENLIPISDRGHDEATKIWCFRERFFSAVKKLAETHWSEPGAVHVIDRATSEKVNASPTVQKAALPDIANEFMRLLPYDAALSAYRKAAITLHPDKGGDATKMARLNTLWARLQKEVYNQ